jgi:hypothetical protein
MAKARISVVDVPDASRGIRHVVSNREPLLASPLAKLPLGSVRPKGWIAHQLRLMVDGQVGRLKELSDFLRDDNGWFGTKNDGWEEQAYWFRGFHDLGVLTGDERIQGESRRWIEGILKTRKRDGYFGPPCMKKVVGNDGKVVCDLWPHMVIWDALRSHWEVTRDRRIVNLGRKFFRFCAALPEEEFVPPRDPDFGNWRPFVQTPRSGDMLPHIYWLYNLTGEDWLLPLATRFHDHVAPPDSEWLNHHVVNFTQRFREPGNYYAQSKEPKHLEETEYWYDMHMGTWGQQPGGIFGADECIRPGKTDPKQAIETCAMVEFNKSFYILGQVTGQALYADRVEDIVFNSFPASQTPDLKGLHYLTAANQPQLDAGENHDYFNKGRQIDYSPYIYRCCQHNVAMGWPYYAEHLWMAAAGNGLCAWMYGPCEVTAKVGRGGEVTIREETIYPFDASVRLTFSMKRGATFPLYLRVPRWCNGFSVLVNRRKAITDAEPGKYVLIERSWQDRDVVEIEMPVALSLRVWEKSCDSVTVDRGPLSFSLRIEEDWRRMPTGKEWAEWEVFPKTPWNYGLMVDGEKPEDSFEVIEKGEVADQPWTLDAASIEIRVKGKRIPNWVMIDETVTDLQPSPIRSDEPVEEIRMVPMGCARLRMCCLPTVGEGPDAREWKKVSGHEEAMRLRLGENG